MSGKSNSNMTVLTDKGILTLFKQEIKNAVNVQVIFFTCSDDNCYMRLSDGKHLSPVIFLFTRLHKPQLGVGDIISVKEVSLVPCEDNGEENALEDVGLHHLYINKYSLLESRESAGIVIGMSALKGSYRDAIVHICPVLVGPDKYDDKFFSNLRWDPKKSKKLQDDRDQFRERGNYFFNQQEFDQAITFYDLAIKRDPYDSRVWANSSQAHLKNDEYAAAEKHALVAIKMDPFNEKAYYRAGQAALQQSKHSVAEAYIRNGCFLCTNNKDLQQLLDEEDLSPVENSYVKITDRLICNFGKTPTVIHSNGDTSYSIGLAASLEIKKKVLSSILQEDYSREYKRPKEKKDNPGKLIKKVQEEKKKKEEEKKKHEDEKRKEQEEEKKRQEVKRDGGTAKARHHLNDTLQEGRRLFESDQVYQAMEMFTKCLAQYNPDNNSRSNVQTLQFIIGMCKLKAGRTSFMEGIEMLKLLCEETSKFTHKAAAHCYLATSFMNINLYKLAYYHAHACCDTLKRPKQFKVIRWPGTDEPISSTKPEILEEKCKELLNRPSTSRPTPEATCRFKDCLTTQGHPYAKEDIFKSDPDFRGYIAVLCEESCTICYHLGCWKAFKDQQEVLIGRKPDKDFIGMGCMTPDCSGKITSIRIYDESGELKNEQFKDKKDKKLAPLAIKMKKKKNKKKDKNAGMKGSEIRERKKIRNESVHEESPTPDEVFPVTEVVTQYSNSSQQKRKSSQQPSAAAAPLPIDPESLDPTQVTVIKPSAGVEEENGRQPKKVRKKNKKAKATATLDLYEDPLTGHQSVQSEYVARLRALKQQKEALEGGMATSSLATDPGAPSSLSTLVLDPNNPFYLPQHLRDNPEELEQVLQKKILVSNTGLKRDTIDTLLEFMFEWLTSEGPMSIHDARLREQVSENFPPEAQTYVNQCGGIRGFLMQSLKFAMIDDIICASSDVVQAQESVCDEVKTKMNTAKYLIKFSDGRRAKKFTHLLDDKSTCSSASSASQVAGSAFSSSASKNTSDSTRSSSIQPVTTSVSSTCAMSENQKSLVKGSPQHKTPPAKTINKLDSFEMSPGLNPTAPEFEPRTSFSEDVMENGITDLMDNNFDSDDEEEDEDGEEEEEVEEEEDEEEEEGEDDDGELNSAGEDLFHSDDCDEYTEQLRAEMSALQEELSHVQEEKQELYDKLCQARSQSKSEVMSYKQQRDELEQQLKTTLSEKQSLVTQRESEQRKMKADMGRMQEEVRTTMARHQSLEMKWELSNDRVNELMSKLTEEEELNAQLKEETRNLQESLTSSSRRAHEAEVKYLCIKKDLIEESLNRTVERLKEEASRMKHLLPMASDETLPERSTLTRTILAWEQTMKTLIDHKKAFTEEGVKLLGMVNQGRPLNALPPGDLKVPAVPNFSVAPLLCLMQNPAKTSANSPTDFKLERTEQPSPAPQPQPSNPPSSKPQPQIPKIQSQPNSTTASLEPQLAGIPLMYDHPMMPKKMVYVNNGNVLVPSVPPPPSMSSPAAFTTGAIPKGPQTTQQVKTPEVPSPTQWPDNHQLFVGQLPWSYSEADLKNLTSTNTVGAIGTLPPKLVRPQPKHALVTSKPGSQSSAPKEDSVSNTPSYKRLIDICKERLGKNFSSPDICSALREVRAMNNNSLSGMSQERILERVRANLKSRRTGSGQATVAPWAGLVQSGGVGNLGPEWQGPKKEGGTTKEETCSICLDVLNASPTMSLPCQHVFHDNCIKDWFKRQSNCPNCRTFALMADEYPKLPHA